MPVEYRMEAARVRRQAQVATTKRVKRQLLEIANGYDDLAKTVEVIARQRESLKAS